MGHSHGSDSAELVERAQNVSKACSRLDFGLVKGLGRQLHGQEACADVQQQVLQLVSMMECGCCFPSRPAEWDVLMRQQHLVLRLAKACCDLIPRQQLRREGYMLLDNLENLLTQAELLGCWSADPDSGQGSLSISIQLQASGLVELLPKLMVQTATQLAAESRHAPHTLTASSNGSSNGSRHTTSSSSNSSNPSTKAMWADGNWQCTTNLLKFATSHLRRWLTGACNAAIVVPLLQPSAAVAAAVLQYCSQHMQQLPVGQAPPAGIMWLCWFAYTLCHVLMQAAAVVPDSDVCRKMMELPHYLHCIMLLTAVMVHSHLLEDQQGVEICPILQQLHGSNTGSSSRSAEGDKHASSSSGKNSSSSSSPQHQPLRPSSVRWSGPDIPDEWQAIHKEPDVFGSDKWQQACQLQLQLPPEQIALLDNMGWGSRMTTWLALLGNGVLALDANSNPVSIKAQAVGAVLAYQHAVTLRRKAAQQRPAQQLELQQHERMPVLLLYLLKSLHSSREQPMAWEPVVDAFGAAVESWVELARAAAKASRPALKATPRSKEAAAAIAAAAAASDAPAYPVPVLQHILVLLTQLLQHQLQQLAACSGSGSSSSGDSGSSSSGDSGSGSDRIVTRAYVLEALTTLSRVLVALVIVTDGSRREAAADLQRTPEWAPFTVRLTALLELFVRSEQHELNEVVDGLVFGLLRPACGIEDWLLQLMTEDHYPARARMGMGISAGALTVAAAYSPPGSPQQLQLFGLLCSSFKLYSCRQCRSLYFAISCTCAAAKTVMMQICRQLSRQQEPVAEAADEAGAAARAAEALQVDALLPWVVLLGRCLRCCAQSLAVLLMMSSRLPSDGSPDTHSSRHCKWIVRLWANAAYSVEFLVVMLGDCMSGSSADEHQASSADQQQQQQHASSHEAAVAAGGSSRADTELRADLMAAGQQLSQHLLALGFNMQDDLLKPLQAAWSSIGIVRPFIVETINTFPELLEDPAEDEPHVCETTRTTAGSSGAASKQPEQQSHNVAHALLVTFQQNNNLERTVCDLDALAGRCCLLPMHQACNNPGCSNLSGQSEAQLASGRSCICAGCRKARYCSKACQADHWPSHKLVCSSFRRAAAAVQAGV